METWKVAIALSMSSNHAAVLGALSAHLLNVNTQVGQLHGGFSKLKGVIAGALSVTAGMALFGVMEKLVDKTKDFSHELAKLQNLGGSMSASVASGVMQKKAFDIAQRVPVKVTDLFKLAGATNSMLGPEETMSVLEDMARFGFVLQANKDYKGDLGADVMKVMRAGELSGRITDSATGHIDDAKLKHYLDLTTRITAATHGMVGPEALLGLAQQGGVSLRGLSDEGYYHMAVAAQAFGGQRAGTALMSTWQQLATGQMFKRTAEGMQEAGMLKAGEWHTDRGGRVIISDAASKRLTSMIGNDPLVFAHQMDENLKAQGVADPLDRLRRIMRALGRATTQRFTAEEAQNYGQILSETDRVKQGYGNLQSLNTFMNNDVEANLASLTNAWDNLLMAVAGPNSENVIRLLQTLTGAINSVTRAVNSVDPNTLSSLGIGLGVLASALVAGGATAILAALGPAGWIAIGITGLIAALAKWGPGMFDAVFAGLDRVAKAMDAFLAWLATVADKIKGLFAATPENKKLNDEFQKNSLGATPMRFNPGQAPVKATPISLSLNVDGRTLAQVVSDKLDALYRYDTSSPAFDGGSRWGT